MINGVHGFFFGKLAGQYILKPENMDGHILIVGGAGSGKSSGIAIPSLMTWKERVFCIDIKGELYKNTAHIRPNIKVFDPLNSTSYGYNPFYVLKETNNPAQEVEAMSLVLVPLPPEAKDPFWIESARNMLTGAMLHFYKEGLSFIETMTQILSTPVTKLIDDIYDNTKIEEAKLYINSFIDMNNETLIGIYAELSRHIMIFATDKNIKECLSRNKKIIPADLEGKSDIYICIPEYLLRQWKNLLTLMVSQFLRHFEKRPDMQASPILFLLDEFPRLGKIEGITDAFATLRSKKITISAIIQSLAQLDLIYGKETRRVIADNCQYKAVLNATDAESQEYFSKIVGKYDKIIISNSKNYSPIAKFPTGSRVSRNPQERYRINPEEFATIDYIALFTPFGFFKVEKDPYYKHN